MGKTTVEDWHRENIKTLEHIQTLDEDTEIKRQQFALDIGLTINGIRFILKQCIPRYIGSSNLKFDKRSLEKASYLLKNYKDLYNYNQ